MKKNLFLTTVLLAGFVAPAFAEDATTPDKKITGGAGTCTVDVLGVSADGATANTIATWTLNSYECVAGQYLDETTLNCTECPTGSYCPGGTFTVEANNSKTACPTDYTSDAAATAESECYMGCELACGTNAECPENATCTYNTTLMVSGKQYVGSSCNTYPSFCPITSMECKEGFNKQTVTKTVENLSKDRKDISYSEYFDYCSANNVSVVGQYGGADGCGSLEPGTVRFNNLNFTELKFEITFNDYGPDTPGLQNFEYVFIDKTLNASYLENVNFETGTEGKYVWIRPIYTYMNSSEITNAPFISIVKNYGFEEMCRLFAYGDQLLNISEEAAEVFGWIIDLMKSGDISSEVNFVEFMEREVLPYIAPEYLDMISMKDLYSYFKLNITLEQCISDPIYGEFASDFGMACQSLKTEDGKWPTVEELQSYAAFIAVFGGVDIKEYKYNAPWILPDQHLMQPLFLEEGTVLTEEQIVSVRDALAIAAKAALVALESKGGLSESYCVANEINISWNPNNGTDNVQGMCYYGSDIFLPLQDPVRPGYTFMGWKLVE